MKLALVSDAWSPQINGVVRTLEAVCDALRRAGDGVEVIHPGLFRTLPCPTYPEIRLALNVWPSVGRQLAAMSPDAIHIATEGPLGLAARRYCRRAGLPFTTSFHTRFPEYIEQRFFLPARHGYRFLRWFHNAAQRMLVATPSLRRELEACGFTRAAPWTRGVDTQLFHPQRRREPDLPRPVHLYVGRVAVEKNLEAFLSLDLEGSKLIVGDGPQRAPLQARYPEAMFVGAKHGEELACYYASADVFVFPSLTDTFGLVMLEALASGTPVAAFPVTGPVDVLSDPRAAAMDACLKTAIARALNLRRSDCRAFGEHHSWQVCATMLRDALAPVKAPSGERGLWCAKAQAWM